MRRSLLTIWLSWIALMAGANTAAPLYPVYAARFGFSSLVLTLIFATYAVVLIPALLLFGRLADRVGRRPVMLIGLVVASVGLALFAVADSALWLFVARGFQGLAVGMVSGPATAALVELDPKRDDGRPAVLAGLAQAGGSMLGPLVAGVLAEWAPAPLHLAYLVVLAATLTGAVIMATLPEPGHRSAEPWRVQRPRVPAEIRADFARVSLTAALVWGCISLYFSIVPSYIEQLLHTRDLALLGAVAALALAASCVAQVVSFRARLEARLGQAIGMGALAVGLVALAVAAPEHSLALLLGGALASGAGHGLGFFNAQRELNVIAPAERRAEVTAAFICCVYVVVAGSVIATGLLGLVVSLSAAVAAVVAVLAAAAVLVAGWQAAAAYGHSALRETSGTARPPR